VPSGVQIIFAFVNQETVSVSTIATVNAVVVVALLLWFRFSGPQFYTPSLVPAIPTMLKYAAIFLAVLFALSPILQTLTQSYSNDTIWAQTILLAAMHICFHNYHITSSTSA
jgi:phosphatidylinositol glycan class C protein